MKTFLMFALFIVGFVSNANAANTCFMVIYSSGKQLLLENKDDVFAGSKIVHFMLPVYGKDPVEFGRITKSEVPNQLSEIQIFPGGIQAPQAVYQSISINLNGFNYERGMRRLRSKTLVDAHLAPTEPDLNFLQDALASVICKKD